MQVWRWPVAVGALSGPRALVCGPFSWPKCGRGSLVCGGMSGGVWRLLGVASILRRPLVKICALTVGVGWPASWVRCHNFRVVGHRSGWGKPKCSPSHFWWSWTVLRFNLSFVVGPALDEDSGESLTRQWCRCQQRRRLQVSWSSLEAFVGMLPTWPLSSRWKPFSGSSKGRRRRHWYRFPLGGVALEFMLTCFSCGWMAWRTFEG
jgi:hypothetical protein